MGDGRELSFWANLKRRHVIKVGIAYIVVGTAVGETANVFLGGLAPPWILPIVLVLLVLGLPVALVLAWAYELTPEGIVRDVAAQTPGEAPDEDPAATDVGVTEERKSIVVLPFDNMSPDPSDAYFSDGLTEEITTQLCYLRSLRVISRSSAMAVKDRKTDVRTIGRDLNVQYVLEGSVRKSGDKLRITAQLIDAGNDEHLWAETYARDLEDVFEMQSEIALKVAGVLRASLDADDVQRIRSRPTDSLDAHDAYLLARHHQLVVGTEESIAKAKMYFEQALELDPDYALARAGLATWYLQECAAFTILPPAEALPRAKAEAERAIALDPDLGDGYAMVAWIEGMIDWQWESAEETARIGVEKDPNSHTAWVVYNYLLSSQGRHEECLAAVARFVELDPLSLVTSNNAAQAYAQAGRLDEALEYAKRGEAMDSGFWGATTLAWVLQCRGENAEALAHVTRIQEQWEAIRRSSSAHVLAYTLGRAGRSAEFEEIAAQLEGRAAEGTATWTEVALAYMGVRDHGRALAYLEKAPDQRPPGSYLSAFVAVDPLFAPLRDEPRFRQVLKRLGLGAVTYAWETTSSSISTRAELD